MEPASAAAASAASVFALDGLSPEQLAVAIAKYSRSAESIRSAARAVTDEQAADFAEKVVLSYGDASVADGAVVPLAFENVSLLAGKVIQRIRLMACIERSTRYVPVSPSEVAPVHAGWPEAAREAFGRAVESLFTAYASALEEKRRILEGERGVQEGARALKLRARALDEARGMLPLAARTSFGLVLSARTLRASVAKWRAHPLPEVRAIAEAAEAAASRDPSFRPDGTEGRPPAPTLARRLPADDLRARTLDAVRAAVGGAVRDSIETLVRASPAYKLPVPRVELVEFSGPEAEIASALFYEAVPGYPMRDYAAVCKLRPELATRALEAARGARGDREPLIRGYEAGGLCFDVVCTVAAWRDLQRHRMSSQLEQPIGVDLGFRIPMLDGCVEAVAVAKEAHAVVKELVGEAEAAYVLPTCTLRRWCLRTNLRALAHLVELRTRPGGDLEYRRVAWEMVEALKAKHPELAACIRPCPIDEEADFFKR